MSGSAKTLHIAELMASSGVKFGTSGARGLAENMTDAVCYAYTLGFLQHLESQGVLSDASRRVALAGDYRPSTDRIMKAIARAALDKGYSVINCGNIPTPAVAYYGICEGIASIMVTGSHIPDDRNGIKYNTANGEILKADELGITAQSIAMPEGLFTSAGWFAREAVVPDLAATHDAYRRYVRRYLDFFPKGCLSGRKIGLYAHSSVARDAIHEVLSALGAEMTTLGLSEDFVPVDTEAIRSEDVELARQWAQDHPLDGLVSTDGDGDRPLVGDENGRWLRGDIAGVLCAAHLGADVAVTPVSSNTAVEKCELFQEVHRTKIGSPYVIEKMEELNRAGRTGIVGYEANGGFLTASPFQKEGRRLTALPTRDAMIVLISLLCLSRDVGEPLSRLAAQLPHRYTYSDRLKDFPTERSHARLAQLATGDVEKDKQSIEAIFAEPFGPVADVDTIDGLRITFGSGEIVHLRASGNAPELRCYNEADSEERAIAMNRICLAIMDRWR